MSLPTEIVEKILFHCDGRTLIAAKNVCKQWSCIVDYVSERTGVWRWCCEEEIPKKELVQYLTSHNREDRDVWRCVYSNWLSFQNMREIAFETVLSPAEIPRITCIDVFEDLVAVGSEDGRVRVYNQYWRQMGMSRHQAEKVNKVTFVSTGTLIRVLKIVIAYPKALIIDDLCGDGYNHFLIEDVVSHSIYKDYICYQKQGGRLTIERLTAAEGRPLDEVWFTRVYSPSNITCINMWNGICTILINNDVRKVDYDSKCIVPISSLPTKCLVNYSLPDAMSSHVEQILRDDIIIVLYRAERPDDKEYMEVIMLGAENEYAKKLFNTSEVLEATITCICLYGNTMVLGVDTGIVYFYHIPSWKHFSIKEYQRKVIIGKHPITNIVVRETKDKRKFYVTSSFNIHEVIGFSSGFLS